MVSEKVRGFVLLVDAATMQGMVPCSLRLFQRNRSTNYHDMTNRGFCCVRALQCRAPTIRLQLYACHLLDRNSFFLGTI